MGLGGSDYVDITVTWSWPVQSQLLLGFKLLGLLLVRGAIRLVLHLVVQLIRIGLGREVGASRRLLEVFELIDLLQQARLVILLHQK